MAPLKPAPIAHLVSLERQRLRIWCRWSGSDCAFAVVRGVPDRADRLYPAQGSNFKGEVTRALVYFKIEV
jgi:hypothetical protein